MLRPSSTSMLNRTARPALAQGASGMAIGCMVPLAEACTEASVAPGAAVGSGAPSSTSPIDSDGAGSDAVPVDAVGGTALSAAGAVPARATSAADPSVPGSAVDELADCTPRGSATAGSCAPRATTVPTKSNPKANVAVRRSRCIRRRRAERRRLAARRVVVTSDAGVVEPAARRSARRRAVSVGATPPSEGREREPPGRLSAPGRHHRPRSVDRERLGHAGGTPPGSGPRMSLLVGLA